MSKAVGLCKSLESLKLANLDSLSRSAAVALVRSLPERVVLRAWGLELEGPSVKLVAGVMQDQLGGSGVTDKDAKVIAALLARTPFLAHLNLSRNAIGDEGILALCAALKQNQSLESLTLDQNRFGDRAARALAKAYGAHPKLAVLSVETPLSVGAVAVRPAPATHYSGGR